MLKVERSLSFILNEWKDIFCLIFFWVVFYEKYLDHDLPEALPLFDDLLGFLRTSCPLDASRESPTITSSVSLDCVFIAFFRFTI